VRDVENSYLALESDEDGEDILKDLQGHSITYRIALGPHKGCQAFMLQSPGGALPPLTRDRDGEARDPGARIPSYCTVPRRTQSIDAGFGFAHKSGRLGQSRLLLASHNPARSPWVGGSWHCPL
jgi:hypothetical protein